MEIKIRTAEEFHADNVTIEIHADRVEAVKVMEMAAQAGKVPALEQRVTELEAMLAESRELAAFNLRRADELEAEAGEATWYQVAINRKAEIRALKSRVVELEAEAGKQKARAEAFKVDLRFEEQHRHKNQEWAERTEARLKTSQEALEIETREQRAAQAEVKRLRDELGQRFTTVEVKDAKAGAREDARVEVVREQVQPLADLLGKLNGVALGNDVREALEHMPAELGTDAYTVAMALHQIRKLLGVRGTVWTKPFTSVVPPDQDLAKLTEKLAQIRAAVIGTEIFREMERYEGADSATLLVSALREVRRIVGLDNSAA